MPADEGAGGVTIDPVVTSDDLLRDERGLVVRDTGIIVSHSVTAVAATPVKFQIVDPIPSKFDVEEIDFHPDSEPPHGRIDAHTAVVSGVVEPDREVVFRYGLRPTQPPRPAAVEEIQRASQPSIELSEPIDPDEADDIDLDVASMSRGESGAAARNAATEGFYFGLKRLMFGADAETRGGSAAASPGGEPSTGRDDRSGSNDEETEADEDPDAERGRSADVRIPGGDPFGGTNEDASLAASISEIESTVDRSDPDEGDGPDDAEADDDTRPFREFFEERDEAGESGAEPDEGDALAGPDAGVVDELVRQLEADHVTEEQRRALGEALADVLATAERPTKSTEVRLRELESKVEEFAVYSTALKELIDVHGPAEEFLESVRGDIEAVTEAVEDIRGDLAAAAKSRNGLDGRLEAAADEVALLDSRVDRVRNRVDDLEVTHESEVGTLEAEVESLEAELDRLDRLEGDLGELRRAVEDGRAKRRAIVEALMEDEPTRE